MRQGFIVNQDEDELTLSFKEDDVILDAITFDVIHLSKLIFILIQVKKDLEESGFNTNED